MRAALLGLVLAACATTPPPSGLAMQERWRPPVVEVWSVRFWRWPGDH